MKPLTRTQRETLEVVGSYPDGCMASDLAVRIDRTIQSAERRLERLRKRGELSLKGIDWLDGRCVFVWVLPERDRTGASKQENPRG